MKDVLKTLCATVGAVATAVVAYTCTHWGRRASSEPAPPQPEPQEQAEESSLQREPAAEQESLTPRRPRREPEGLTAKKLLDVLTLTRHLIQRHLSLPILECVLLEPGTVTATDSETRFTLALPALHVPPVCVNAVRLREALRMIKGNITVELDGEALVINGSLRLATLPASEYPAPISPTGDGWTLGPTFVVPPRFGDVLPAMARDESRPQLHGVCFDLSTGAVVASDGHRLHLVTGERRAGGTKHTIAAGAARTLSQFATQGVHSQVFMHDAQRGADEGTPHIALVFTVPSVTLWTRAVDIEFPDYMQVIPSTPARYTVTCDTTLLIEALQQTIAVGPKKVICTVSLTCVERGLRVRLESQEDGQCCVIVPASGWRFKRYVGVQAPYLLDLLQCAGGKTVTLSIDDATRSLLLRAGDFTGVVMPVRIDTTNHSDMEDEPAPVPVEVGHPTEVQPRV